MESVVSAGCARVEQGTDRRWLHQLRMCDVTSFYPMGGMARGVSGHPPDSCLVAVRGRSISAIGHPGIPPTWRWWIALVASLVRFLPRSCAFIRFCNATRRVDPRCF
eukprot:scaffold748_cov329-Pavlova_lutheri.AAC.4